jgi:membrane protein
MAPSAGTDPATVPGVAKADGRVLTLQNPPERISPWRLGGLTLPQLATRVWNEIWADEILDRAAALSYYFMFAVFPTLLFLTTLVGMLPGPRLTDQLLGYLDHVLPPDAFSLVGKTLEEITRGAGSGLLSVGAVAALWGASNGMGSIITAVNVAYDAKDARPWWKTRLLAVSLTLAFSVFTLAGLLLLVFGEALGHAAADWMGQGDLFKAAWTVARWPLASLGVLTGIALVYYVAPAVRQRWYWVTPGSVFAVGLWLAVSAGLRVYVIHFGNYNKTYGSIGGVILLLLWFYLGGLALLIGAEVNAEIARAASRRGRRRPDTEHDAAA